ncbi:MAG: T9SS type A sorting domain-containing protein [Bacteroidetes bacterium]|nr:T9SS type A sorting domain-containing protein [Bacteroidota bacterium]
MPLTFCELLNTYNGNYILQRKHAIGSILFHLLDSTGKLVLSGELNPGEQEKIISLQSFSSGIYLLHTTTSNSSKTFKIENH